MLDYIKYKCPVCGKPLYMDTKVVIKEKWYKISGCENCVPANEWHLHLKKTLVQFLDQFDFTEVAYVGKKGGE